MKAGAEWQQLTNDHGRALEFLRELAALTTDDDRVADLISRARDWLHAPEVALPAARPEPPAAERKEKPMAQGTYRCPQCGKDEPHYHEPAETVEDSARLNGCALREFGQHKDSCDLRRVNAWGHEAVRDGLCSCGFQAALEAAMRRDMERVARAAVHAQEEKKP